MNSLQKNRYNAYVTSLEYLAENAAITKPVPAIDQTCQHLREMIVTIFSINKRIVGTTGEVVSKKQQLRDEMTKQAQIIAGVLKEYAKDKQDTLLKENIDSLILQMQQSADAELIGHCRTIFGKALEIIYALRPYGITKDFIKGSESALKQFAEYWDKPRNLMAERKHDRNQVREMLRYVNRIFEEKLDPMLVPFKKKHGKFYRKYIVTRSAVGPGFGPTRVVGWITDYISYDELSNVKITLLGTGHFVFSGENGFYIIKTPQLPSVLLVFEKEGYKTKTALVAIKKGNAKARNVELKKK